jgi:hypothetical protein
VQIRLHQSIETASLDVPDDTYHLIDSHKLTFLVSLHSSAAFDMVDHLLLPSRLVQILALQVRLLTDFAQT